MKKHINSTGFTIIELIVTAAVTSLLVIALVNTFLSISRLQQEAERLAIATEAGESKLESLRNGNYNNIPISPPSIDFTGELPAELTEPRSGSVSVSEPRDGLKRLDVTITYQESGVTRSVKLSTLVGKLGISQ